jgi:hypothetical protein
MIKVIDKVSKIGTWIVGILFVVLILRNLF